ncbi:MAG: hypothetical protein CENE_02347 [Candidatus Celerinatantimonas neptuna]|nr:MAG: hypothetical protein CENE_02347 [Candidatus Celerinatantimonas neptuna]
MNSEHYLIHGLADLIMSIGQDAFIDKLVYLLRSNASFDDYVVLIYHPDYKPVVLSSSFANDEWALWERYLNGAYLLSPFYDFCTKGGEGFVSLADIAPDDFYSSAYFKEYFESSHLVDEVGLVVQANDHASYLLSLGRTKALSTFNTRVSQKLQALFPVLNSLVKMHDNYHELPKRASHRNIKDYVLNFGEGILTPREKEVMQFLIRGYSSKESARSLQISYETERVHRKNIYAKLAVNSQKELLGKIFDDIVNIPHS